jgi:hypothetical protein
MVIGKGIEKRTPIEVLFWREIKHVLYFSQKLFLRNPSMRHYLYPDDEAQFTMRSQIRCSCNNAVGEPIIKLFNSHFVQRHDDIPDGYCASDNKRHVYLFSIFSCRICFQDKISKQNKHKLNSIVVRRTISILLLNTFLNLVECTRTIISRPFLPLIMVW